MKALTTRDPNGTPAEFAWTGISYKQSKRTAFAEMKKFLLPVLGGDAFYDSDMRVDLPNGNKIHFLGLDNPTMLRGLHLHGMVTDELQEFQKADISAVLFGVDPTFLS
jgi:hypothetical protein